MDKQIESGDTQNATSEAQSAIAAVLPAANSLAPSEVMDTFPLPIRTLVDESHELAARIGAFYQADPNSGRPGFESVAFRVPADTPQRMTNLVTAAREMVLICILGNATTQRGLRAEFEQAEKTLRTIKRTLAFYYDDGITTQEDEQLEALASEHVDETSSLANLSAALYDYGRMAQRDNEALAIIETWDKQLPELALQLSATLAGPAPEVDKKDIDLRNRILTLLSRESRKIRRAAEFLYADNFNDLYRRYFTSSYARNRRLERMRRAAQ